MLLGELQFGLADLLLQIRSCCADLIMDDVIFADGPGFLKNITDKFTDNGIYFLGPVSSRAIAIPLMLGAVVAFIDGHTTIGAIGRVMGFRAVDAKTRPPQ